MKILILALSGIGDALMFTPALKLLRESLPDAEIDALVMFKGAKDIYERSASLNKVIYFDFMKEGVIKSLMFINKIRNTYDASVNVYPSNRMEYNIINFIIGAGKRAGAKYLRKDIINLGPLNNIRVTELDSMHNVQTNIHLIEKLLDKTFLEEPPLDFPLSEDDLSFAGEYLDKINLNKNDLVIGFHPGSAVLKNHSHRRWESEKFGALGQILINKLNAKILLFGGPEELELKKVIKDMIDSPDSYIVETENLPRSAAIIKRCNLFVSNDSSLMHVASAMQRKVVSIIGPTNQNFIHPWKTDYKIVTLNLECSPCFFYSPRPLICSRTDVKYKCIKELSVEMVFNAVTGLLNN
ncbi:MAG: glycosyltransferase family 9 protein [Ignavibacteriaceae bacterium]|nr:glycosyltransferase family 9 protein [Ignavibacteriaceae bacterium]